ncbi:unnamed protein product [Protopolystoma xenopodis]|uniref:Uncharacterized protein n=1 Tax=Protopolystoma xenopodis TaxID=117903 RepID=A0A3S5CD75_9PLAT|nr:unnamed protein product [Protopolystoma xenopodis]
MGWLISATLFLVTWRENSPEDADLWRADHLVQGTRYCWVAGRLTRLPHSRLIIPPTVAHQEDGLNQPAEVTSDEVTDLLDPLFSDYFLYAVNIASGLILLVEPSLVTVISDSHGLSDLGELGSIDLSNSLIDLSSTDPVTSVGSADQAAPASVTHLGNGITSVTGPSGLGLNSAVGTLSMSSTLQALSRRREGFFRRTRTHNPPISVPLPSAELTDEVQAFPAALSDQVGNGTGGSNLSRQTGGRLSGGLSIGRASLSLGPMAVAGFGSGTVPKRGFRRRPGAWLACISLFTYSLFFMLNFLLLPISAAI